ncbi:LptF/LptG family permease [Deinococcus yavapaiensis]|uniref:Lipopolysaccharide export system permease protein n=1 Tax=Deinococcus yavapaiensis KR-236 TaxID=694435 RepID=A0A318SI08_9DEIO|nr:LptF/LptG family permease [Deinococcus yavapaiensis]PYE53606.1 lipopolysaccharide export system permease protein [Deinococcus yavapaiensis KR-236]
MTRVTRYVLAEILPLLAGGTVAVILFFLLGALYDVLAPLIAKGAAPLLVAQLAAYAVPLGLSTGLPLGLLFAVLLGLSRLASDSELKGLSAGGFSATRLLWPLLGLALLVAVLSFLNGETLVPRAAVQAQQTGREILLDNPRVLGLDQAKTVLRDALGRAYSFDRVLDDGRFEGVRIVQTEEGGPPKEVFTAARGRVDLKTGTLRLEDGQRVTYQGAQPIMIMTFSSVDLPVQDLQANLQVGNSSLAPVNLSLAELRTRITEVKKNGGVAYLEATALQRKFAQPLAALAFAFFGVALALFSFRSGTSVGFVWVVLLTFAYYATSSVFRVMGEQGALDPALAAWAPNLLYLAAGGGLLIAAHRR